MIRSRVVEMPAAYDSGSVAALNIRFIFFNRMTEYGKIDADLMVLRIKIPDRKQRFDPPVDQNLHAVVHPDPVGIFKLRKICRYGADEYGGIVFS